METGSNSRVTGSDSMSGSNAQCSSHSISDLPKEILVKILLRLTVKRIFVCKCVCKSWYDLILDPEFAQLHFDQAEACPLLESSSSMYLVQPEKHDFELNVRIKPDLIFQVPPLAYDTVNSCNGLVLLCITSPVHNDHLSVCNPITGELIHLPDGRNVNLQYYHVKYCLGFSSTSKEYKVIRMICSRSSTSRDMLVEVHVLGSKSWKEKGLLALPVDVSCPTYVNGFLSWSDDLIISPIVCFDVEKEYFQSFSVKGVDHLELFEKASIGELGQELCVYGFLSSGAFQVWAMKDRCDKKVWSRVFSFDMPSHGRQLNGPLRPVKYLNDGSLLMFHSYMKSLICIDSRKSEVRYLKVCGTKLAIVRAVAYIPSFVSLKHALSRQNVIVKALIETQWFADVERETRDVYIAEKDLCNLYSDSDSDLNHLSLKASDSDSDYAGLESLELVLYQEEIYLEDGDREIDSEDRDEDQELDPEDVDSEDRNGNQEFSFEDKDGKCDKKDSVHCDPKDGYGEFDSKDRVDKFDTEDIDEFNPEGDDHRFGHKDVDPELDPDDRD